MEGVQDEKDANGRVQPGKCYRYSRLRNDLREIYGSCTESQASVTHGSLDRVAWRDIPPWKRTSDSVSLLDWRMSVRAAEPLSVVQVI